ncbi:hypothetical protein GCM10027039_21460 [Terrabacter koreensis]
MWVTVVAVVLAVAATGCAVRDDGPHDWPGEVPGDGPDQRRVSTGRSPDGLPWDLPGRGLGCAS